MRVALFSAVAVLWSCTGSSELQLNGAPGSGSPPVVPGARDAIPEGQAFLPPLAGHRVAVSGTLAAVSDPEGAGADGRAPAVWFVELESRAVSHVTLPDGSRPSAIELDGRTAWVVLEGSRGVAALDADSATVKQFYETCPAPADLALSNGAAWVACSSGEVAKISAGTVSVVRVGSVPSRIAAADGEVLVAFADATVAAVDLGGVHGQVRPLPPLFTTRTLSANTPRRLIARGEGSFVLLHQQSAAGELATDGSMTPTGGTEGGAYSGGGACPQPATTGAVSEGSASGAVAPARELSSTLAIDEAVSPSGTQTAVADPAAGQVLVLDAAAPGLKLDCGGERGGTAPLPLPGATSVAFGADGKLLALTAGSALTLNRVDLVTHGVTAIALRSRSVPAGFELFHASPKPEAPAVPNVACASCHPAGLTNGATLTVNGVTHKVMTVGGHLAGMQNVHWDNHSFQTAVIDGTWRRNMGGRDLTALEAQSLAAFVAQLRLPEPPSQDAARVAEGLAAFDKAGCASCHVPSTHFTNDSQADVGRGMHRVPSLVGLAYSAPYMSDGCARTLEQRFSDAACGGGALHGHVEQLSATELDSLITFLKTL